MFKKSSLLTLLLLSSVISTTAFAASSFKSPLKITEEEYSDVYSGVKFQYLDLEDRLLIVNNFLKSVELEYAPLDLKEKVIGINFKKIKENAIARENAAGDVTISAVDRKDPKVRAAVALEQAQKNMEFLDRMQMLVAEFKDTHFSIYESIPRPVVYNGLLLTKADGKIIVARMDKKVISRIEALGNTNLQGIQIGDEVVAIDGVSIQDKINELKPYISGSSEAYIESEAIYYLMIRSFRYPTKSTMTITFANGAKYKIPYFANVRSSDLPRLDAISYFNKVGIEVDATTTGLQYDNSTGKWSEAGLSYSGYRVSALGRNLKDIKEYMTDSGSLGMRTGYYMQKGKTHAVMQLFTFSSTTLSQSADRKQSFMDAIREFALDAKENELPVILDLRSNGGGNGAYPAQLLSIFTEAGQYYGAPSRGIKMTTYARNLNEPMYFQMLEGEDVSFGITYDELRGVLNDAIDERKVYPPMYNMTGVIPADYKVKGFDNKMVVLVTPDCISACDMTASLFSSSKRATLIGTHSNGTGAGYSSTGQLNTNWGDQLRQLKSNIPNFLFGKPHSDILKNVYEEDSVYELCTENKPTVADIHYSTTLLDVKADNKGWLMMAAEVLSE